MAKSGKSWRSFTALLVTWAFLVLIVTGLVLYIVPHGRVAYWVHWGLAGLDKDGWADLHMLFGGVFIVAGAFHLYFNWRPFKQYLRERAAGHARMSRALLGSLAFTLLVAALSVAYLPPASWVFDLNAAIKDSWVTERGMEPPFGHAEEVSLAGIARRMRLDLDRAQAALREAGYRFDGPRQSLEAIARANNTTPMAVYGVIREFPQETEAVPKRFTRPEEVEAEFAGTGLGRKTLAEVCAQVGMAPATARERLEAAGIGLADDETFRAVAERHGVSPIDLLTVMLVEGYRPEGG